MAIRINKGDNDFTGGELIELKDSKSYTVSSFNSTIPAGKKKITEIISGEKSRTKQQMEEAGNDMYYLPVREVYYLVRGRKDQKVKVCLVHGSFFQTVEVEELIRQSFGQLLEERLADAQEQISDELKAKLITIFSVQENFSKVRNVKNASVKLRFRIMTEVKAEGNILNSRKYPEIRDNTLNFVLPCQSNNEEDDIIRKMKRVFPQAEFELFNIFKIQHHFNGKFIVFQVPL